MSTALETKVEIGSFLLHPVSDLTLNDIYIGSPGRPNDTMISAEHLQVGYVRILDVLKNQLHITHVDIRKADLYIIKNQGDSLNNLDETLQRIMPPKKPNSVPFLLQLDGARANQLNVKVIDEVAGTDLHFYLDRADVNLKSLDIPTKLIEIEDADIDDPIIRVKIGERLVPISNPPVASMPDSNSVNWKFMIGRLRLRDGQFSIKNETAKPVQAKLPQSIDFSNMELADVDIQVDSFNSNGWNYAGLNPKIHVLHSNGFEIENLSAKSAKVASNGVQVKDLNLKTARTLINNSFDMNFKSYSDFARFSHKVELVIPDADVRIHVGDLLIIAPVLQEQELLMHNQNETLTFSGNVRGILNDMSVRSMNAGIAGLSIHGDLHTYDLTVTGKQRLKLNVSNSFFSAEKIMQILPQVKLPEFVSKLGQIQFVGQFDGNPNDFLAAGNFTTDLGAVGLDLDMNLLNTMAGGDFKGKVTTTNFDIGTLLSNQKLGRVTMSGRVIEGHRIGKPDMYADITGEIDSLQFNGFTYRNARVDGQIQDQVFNGTFDIIDPKIDFHMEGELDYSTPDIKLNLISRLDSVSLDKLGLSKVPLQLSGVFELDGIVGKVDVIQGDFKGSNIIMNRQDSIYKIDTLHLVATIDSSSKYRSYTFYTPIVEGSITGYFNPSTVVNHTQNYLHKNYPRTIPGPEVVVADEENDSLSWNIRVIDTENWLDLLPVKELVIVQAETEGVINLSEGEVKGYVNLPEVHLKGISVYGANINFNEKSGKVNYDLEVIAADLNESLFFEEVYFKGDLDDDKINVNVKTDHLAELIDELDVDIVADPEGGSWGFQITPRNLEMLGKRWNIPAGNRIEIHKDYFRLDSFHLASDSQAISVQDINGKGIKALLSGFDLNSLNAFLNNDKFDFSGTYTLNAEIDNIYDIKELKAELSVPDFQINEEDYGVLHLVAGMDNPRDSVQIDLELKHNESLLTANGSYLPPFKSIPEDRQNYLRLHINANDFPLDFLEFLVGSNIRDTEGAVDLNLDLKGKINELDPSGEGKVYSGSTTIDFLGVHYSFHEQAFKITPTLIDFSDITLYDVQGNTALVKGGITHRHFTNLGLNLEINSDKIQALNLRSGENDNFYGTAVGSLHAVFSGTIANPSIFIRSNTMLGTHIYIPLSGARADLSNDFVIFLENGALPTAYKPAERQSTIDLTMVVNANEDATVEIVFDENTGEVLRGNGVGEITLTMDRNGTLGMKGEYRITSGNYLFTNFVVRKSFTIEENSSISWQGDPYEAQLNVTATYSDLSASLYPLIQEYLAGVPNSNVEQAAQENTDVELELILKGSLLHPDISFDIRFPEISGELKAYADSKINTLRANQSALMQQVVGLLWSRSFLPASTALGSTMITKGIDNTLSELISTTLSSYLGGLLADVLPTNSTITKIDFNVNVGLPVTQGGVSTQDPLNNPINQQFGIDLPLEFFNRLTVKVGADYISNSVIPAAGNKLAGDVEFEYELSQDGTLRIRAYNRNNYTIQGRKNKLAVGLRVRKEYASFRDIFRRKKNVNEVLPEEETTN